MPCQDPLPSPRQPELTVLVDEHADGDAAEVEAVQEVLDVLVGDWVIAVGVLVLQHSLCHGGYYIIVPVPDGDQGFGEPAEKAGICPYPVSDLGPMETQCSAHPYSPSCPSIFLLTAKGLFLRSGFPTFSWHIDNWSLHLSQTTRISQK